MNGYPIRQDRQSIDGEHHEIQFGNCDINDALDELITNLKQQTITKVSWNKAAANVRVIYGGRNQMAMGFEDDGERTMNIYITYYEKKVKENDQI